MRLFKKVILVLLVVVCAFPMLRAAESAKQERPNILFIFSDDHAYQAISVYGSGLNQTPNIDRIASEGMRFTKCVVSNPICGPCRAVVQTGKYGHVNGFVDNGCKFDNTQQTFPKLLQQAGYQTAIVGKWHLFCDAQPGFDYSDVFVGQGYYYNPVMIRNGEQIKRKGYTTEIVTDLTLDWLKNRDPNKPFLMMCQHNAPHRNWAPLPKHYNKFKDVVFPEPSTLFDDYRGRGRAALEQDMTIADTLTPNDLKLRGPLNTFSPEQKKMWHEMFDPRIEEFERLNLSGDALTRWKYQCYMRDYLSCIDAIDEGVGRLLQYLDESGLAENTIVVYGSDQGFYLGEHGWFDKRFMYNESFKTPCLVRWPEKIKSGSVNDAIVSPLDFAETFLEVAGVTVPADMQGKSLVPVLEGKTPDDWRKTFYYHYYEYPAVHMAKRNEGVYDGRFKLMHFYNDIDEWELYDNLNDPNEMQNVIDKPEYKSDLERLQKELARLKQELKVPQVEVMTDSPLKKVTPDKPAINSLREIIHRREFQQLKNQRQSHE